jgi:hypothetical protein
MMYKDMYKNIRTDVIDVSKALVGRKETSIYRLSEAEALNRMKIWLTYVSEMYKITLPSLEIAAPEECYGHGCYTHDTNTIKLPKISVVSLFHEFKHCLDWQRGLRTTAIAPTAATADVIKQTIEEIIRAEDRARGWSMSLFNKVNPRLCDKAIKNSRVLFQ